MAHVIRLRDVARAQTHEFGPDVPVLRGPYDLFRPDGVVHRHGVHVEWKSAGRPRIGRVVEASLGEVQPGERLLVRLGGLDRDETGPAAGEDDWWLCEVEAVDGLQGMP